jgi:D-xylose transport system ATP-binding protein
VYVSHRLDEVFRMADRITVLRDGRTVGSADTASLDEARVVSWMVGRTVETLFPAARPAPGAVVFEVRHLTVEDPHPRRPAAHAPAGATPPAPRPLLDDVSFSVRAGEVLGIGGLIGAGRTELLMTLFGAPPGRRSGTVMVAGVPVTIGSPADAMTYGLALLGEDRARLGLFPARSITENLVLAALRRISKRGITSPVREHDLAVRTVGELRIRPAAPHTRAGNLSGGNQQKVLLGRWLLTGPRVLLLDEPTRGVDVGAREEIYGEIDRLARSGLAIVIVSSDLPELIGLSDRVIVLRTGRLAATFERDEITPELVMTAAAGSALQ